MNGEATRAPVSARAAGAPNLMGLMTRARWIEVARIGVTGLLALLFWRGLVPIQWLWVAVAVGLYPLVKTGYLDLVQEHKVGTEIFVTVATLVAVFGGETVAGAVLMVITLMIFTSPAELGLATPLVMIAAIARAARSGILIKGGIHLEALSKVDVMVFDTTGTLTANRPQVVEVYSRAPLLDENALLRLAAAADRRSAHPLAKAVVCAAAERSIAVPEPETFEQFARSRCKGFCRWPAGACR